MTSPQNQKDAADPLPDRAPSALTAWTLDALDHLYDLPYLRRLVAAPAVAGHFADGRATQDALLQAIQQLRPPTNVPLTAPAWRLYNVLHLRYEQGLAQSEVAAKLGIGLRHLQREQQRAVESVASLLRDDIARPPATGHATPLAGTVTASEPHTSRVDEHLRSALALLDPLLQQHNLQVNVRQHAPLPGVKVNAMILRQLVIAALNWLISDAANCTLDIAVLVDASDVVIDLRRPAMPGAAPRSDLFATLAQLADGGNARLMSRNSPGEPAQLELRLPVAVARCVLVVDDNPDEIELIRHHLEQSREYYVVAVTRADDAIRQAGEQRPECILLDVMMPGRDGWELLTRLKAFPETAAIPVVISSVLRERELALALGAAGVLVKPFESAQLIDVLRLATGSR
jgi:CheY-like chemotaxis protein